MKKFVLIIAAMICACSPPSPQLVELDLLVKGIPIKIMAPKGAAVNVDDLGIIKDVTVTDSLNYFVQIFSSKASTLDPRKVKEEQKEIVQDAPFFSKITQEDEHGFIYEKKIDEDHINYDFRFVRIQGDDEYLFQAGLGGGYDLPSVKTMYRAVQ